LHIIIIDNFCNKEATMSCLALHSQTLRQRGFRMTPQRLAILESLHHDGHLSPTQIYARVRQTGMAETTVYRTLEFLANNGIIASATAGNGHLAYELAQNDHHHLVCRACGQEVEIEHARLQSLYAELETVTGFRSLGSHLTFFGLCPECQTNSQ